MIAFLASGIIFLSIAAAIYALHHYTKDTEHKMSWWKWVLTVFWLVLFLITFASIGTFIGEGASQAVLPGGGFFVGVTLVTGAVLCWLLFFAKFGKKS